MHNHRPLPLSYVCNSALREHTLRSTAQQVLAGITLVAITFSAAGIGAVASIEAADFYQQLQLPSWAPPAWLFGPVWTMLYLLMAIGAWLVWRADKSKSTQAALLIFIVQLLPNALWSWLFFSWKQGALAFADILLLIVLVVTTCVLFWKISRTAAVLLLPYLAWILFAAALNYSVWKLNPGLLG